MHLAEAKTGKGAVPDDIAALSFEQALGELEQIVRKLESGDSHLSDAIDLYQRGAFLKRHCAAQLRLAEEKIERITLDSDGAPTGTAPLDPEP